MNCFADQLGFVKRHIDRALGLTAGFEQTADADRAYVVVGEAFKVRVGRRCRPEIACDFGALSLMLPDESKQDGQADAKTGDAEFSVTLTQKQSQRTGFQGNFPEPSPLVEASQVVTIDGYKFDAMQPVTHVEATSTRVDRVPLRMVPAYTLMVEPNQTVEVLGKNGEAVRCVAARAFVRDAGAQGFGRSRCAAGMERQQSGGVGV